MIHAYDRIYLEKAQTALATMLDYAVHDLRYDIDAFFDLFLVSGVAGLFETGDPNTLVGHSGIELTYEVLAHSGLKRQFVASRCSFQRSPEYWTGWALAYYQWQTGMSFEYVARCVPVGQVRALYDPYHEMDIRQFCDHMNERIYEGHPQTNLKRIRTQAGLSQRRLADASGVPLRTIQQYEQRQKNINRAQAESLVMLAFALHCDPVDLIEPIGAQAS